MMRLTCCKYCQIKFGETDRSQSLIIESAILIRYQELIGRLLTFGGRIKV